MSMFSKLSGLAKKALDGSGSGSGSGSASGPTDWRSVVRSAADALTGDGRPPGETARQPHADGYTDHSAPARPSGPPAAARPSAPATSAGSVDPADRAAIARYDYLLKTADPHQIEEVHREAFARLTPAQRAQIDERMRAELPESERPRSSGPDDLARAAARTEAARPGVLSGLLARAGGLGRRSGGRGGSAGVGRGALAGGAVAGAGLAAGGLLAAVAGGAVVSSVAGPLLEQAASFGVDFDALAGSLDLEGLTGGLTEGLAGGVDELAAGAGETVAGLGDQVGGLGEQVGGLGEQVGGLGEQVGGLASGFGLPGLDDLFGR